MKKNITIIGLLIFIGCTFDSYYREVMVNKTVKVFSKDYHDKAENYTFKWTAPIGPHNNKVIFDLKNDMLIFTPKQVGKYEVNLTIEDISDEVVDREIFYFKAIPETIEVAIVEPNKETKQHAISTITKKNPRKHTSKNTQSNHADKLKYQKSSNRDKQLRKTSFQYAIQIAAWPSQEQARKHQLELIDEGFDAYTQRFYFEEKDEVWFRVRVGNFSNRDKALLVKKQIESFSGMSTWFDIMLTK